MTDLGTRVVAGCQTAALAAVFAATQPTHGVDAALEHIARRDIQQLVNEVVPRWTTATHAQRCVYDIAVLRPYLDGAQTIDPWGRSYRLRCWTSQTGVRHAEVSSAGPGRATWFDDIAYSIDGRRIR